MQDVMSPELYDGLLLNGVNLSEDYLRWNTEIMVKNIGTVMGLEIYKNPDFSYVLTTDNVIKILAIQMRFRYVQ